MPAVIGLVVVNRLDLLRLARRGGSRLSPAVEMEPEEVFRRYRGFDGIFWPEKDEAGLEEIDGLAELRDLPLVETYFGKLTCKDECDLLAVGPPGARLGADWIPAGFDLGYCEFDGGHFSVVLNEILFGKH